MPTRSPRRQHARPARLGSPWRGRSEFILAGASFSLLIPTAAVLALAAGATGQAHVIAAEIQRFLLFYAGVFALITLTAAVGAGLAATDRAILSPGRRVLAQAFHRAVSLVALSALATHIMLEVIAHRAGLAAGQPFRPGPGSCPGPPRPGRPGKRSRTAAGRSRAWWSPRRGSPSSAATAKPARRAGRRRCPPL